uniref:Helitron_like_N domain-containing protein n=1 Tax=Caenorhabditis tropicalis TaxID=1561998 RepID=A0A1I7TTN8_9PELO
MQNVNQFGRTRYPKPPPRYYDEDNKRAVEVCVPSYDSIFEPAETANASIHTHLPDPSLGFPSSDFSSDILNILRDFLSNTVAPICGSRIQILLKRYPNENYTSTLIETFQSNHVSVNVITSNTPSGGLFHQTMYEIATRTNGVCAFEDEAYFNKLENPYILYSVNVPVSGNGSVVLPPLTVKYPTYYCPLWVALTVQDHGK